MKFKVEPKDFFLFVVYSIMLLYLCALGVSNLFCLLKTGTFYGLFPLSAFTEYFPFTIALFLGALIFIFTSVSSYIFSKDKGKGVGLKVEEKKTDDGYARWAKEKEIKEGSKVVKVNTMDKEIKAAGLPLISKEKEIWVDNGDYHNLVIGSTGSGKTENLVFPMVNLLAKKGESMIITDPKGEIYRKTAENLKSRGYKIIVLNFREPDKGNAWNPLSLPYQYYKEGDIDKSTELLDDVALNILYDPSNKSDSDFWEKGSADYFSGLAIGLFQDAKENQINLNSINYMSTVGEERYATSNFIKEYFNLKGKDSNAYMFANTVINAPSDTKGGLLSTFSQKIRMFSTREKLSEMLSYSDFDMRDIGREKTAVFMIIHDEKKTYHTLMTIFIKQCYETLIDVAQKNGGKLQYRTNFILDEFANMPPLKDVDSMVSAARSRDIRFTFIIQNYAQLNDIYGENVAQVIRGNCGNLVYLISTELKALEEISKMCGEVKSKDKDKTASTPLITVSDLQKLKLGDAIIMRLRTSPFKTKFTPNFKIDWGEDYPEGTYNTRQTRQIELFDLKQYVTEERKKRMMNNPTGMPGANPMGGFNNMNGFGGMGNTMNPYNPYGVPNNPFRPTTPMGGMNQQPNPFRPSSMNSPLSSPMPHNPMATESTPSNPLSNSQVPTSNINNMNNSFDRNANNMYNGFGPTPMNTNPMNSSSIANPFNNGLQGMDIDAMMKDIDAKLKELDEEEKRQKEKLKQQNEEFLKPKADNIVSENSNANLELEDKLPNLKDNKEEVLESNNNSEISKEKPKINIDVDSVIMNENVITDDEFFDDFFGEDE